MVHKADQPYAVYGLLDAQLSMHADAPAGRDENVLVVRQVQPCVLVGANSIFLGFGRRPAFRAPPPCWTGAIRSGSGIQS